MADVEQFPRGTALPRQSPMFWVAEKDRYLRQLLIRDIEQVTGRQLLVYFADCEAGDSAAQIFQTDDSYLHELFRAADDRPVDFLIETNGGYTDATEKLVAILHQQTSNLRVIVPRRAKSNGTLVALAASEIVMGPPSELGPIDPFINLAPQQVVPAHFIIVAAPNVDPIILQAALHAVEQTKTLAKTLLRTGMMKGKEEAEIADTVEKLATRNHFHSHGSVIDADEAAALGLKVTKLSANDELWQRLWLLRCLYSSDLRSLKLIKIFESAKISNTLRTS